VKILTTTLCYPTPNSPTQGIFVQRRIEAMARRTEVRVVCPVPYFPWGARGAPLPQPDATPPAEFPRMYYIPGILKTLDGTFFALSLASRLRRLRSAYPFDIIDAHFVWPDGVGAAIVAWKLGIPIVVTVRGKIVSQTRYRLRRRRIAAMLRSVDGRIAVSSDLAQRVRTLIGDETDVRVIPNGVDSTVFRPRDRLEARRELGLSPAARYIVSVGQVREIKGFDRLTAALAGVRRRAGDVRLILIGPQIGETAYERRLSRIIHDNRLNASVNLIGPKAFSDVARYLAAADVFALATRSEGWCNAIQEALAVGTPVVATDVGGNRELVREERLGLLVPFGQERALVDALVSALGRTWDRSFIALVGGARSWDLAASETLNYFEEILGRHPRKGRAAD
jgi:teichuronic acid biosynthesis glycosyltransferase TuaC